MNSQTILRAVMVAPHYCGLPLETQGEQVQPAPD